MESLPPPPATTGTSFPPPMPCSAFRSNTSLLPIRKQGAVAPHVGATPLCSSSGSRGCCSAAGSSVAALTGKQAPGAFRVNRPSVRRGLVRDVFDADGLVGRTGVRHQAAERVWSTPRSQARSRGRGGAAAVRGNRHRHGEGPPHCVPQVREQVEQRGVDALARPRLRCAVAHDTGWTRRRSRRRTSRAGSHHSPWARRATSPGRDAHR